MFEDFLFILTIQVPTNRDEEEHPESITITLSPLVCISPLAEVNVKGEKDGESNIMAEVIVTFVEELEKKFNLNNIN